MTAVDRSAFAHEVWQDTDMLTEHMDDVEDNVEDNEKDQPIQLGRRVMVFLKRHHMEMRDAVFVTLTLLASPSCQANAEARKRWMMPLKDIVEVVGTFVFLSAELGLSSRWASWLIGTFTTFASYAEFSLVLHTLISCMTDSFANEDVKARITHPEKKALVDSLEHIKDPYYIKELIGFLDK